jgi:hypothetical protein
VFADQFKNLAVTILKKLKGSTGNDLLKKVAPLAGEGGRGRQGRVFVWKIMVLMGITDFT